MNALARCEICGDFHFAKRADALCLDCCRAISAMRSRVEKGGGTVNVIDGAIKVRTKAQMSCPVETLHYLSEVRDIEAGMRGGHR